MGSNCVSPLQAVTVALTGRTVLLSASEAGDYQNHISGYQAEFQPVDLRECELVQSIGGHILASEAQLQS